jgi:hypothetical protein
MKKKICESKCHLSPRRKVGLQQVHCGNNDAVFISLSENGDCLMDLVRVVGSRQRRPLVETLELNKIFDSQSNEPADENYVNFYWPSRRKLPQ